MYDKNVCINDIMSSLYKRATGNRIRFELCLKAFDKLRIEQQENRIPIINEIGFTTCYFADIPIYTVKRPGVRLVTRTVAKVSK